MPGGMRGASSSRGAVVEILARLVERGMVLQFGDDGAGAVSVEFVPPRLGREFAVAVDGPGGVEDVLLGMETVENRSGPGRCSPAKLHFQVVQSHP